MAENWSQQKKIGREKKFRPEKKFWSEKYLGPKKYLGPEKNKFWAGNFFVGQKICWKKFFWGPK